MKSQRYHHLAGNSLRMTASELKRQHEYYNPESYFFDRPSMRFFGDTMANYYVPAGYVKIETWDGETHTCYELQRKRPVKHGLKDSAFFDTTTFKRILPKIGE